MNDFPLHSDTLQRHGNGHEGQLERHFPHPIEALWAMLTEPAALAQWLAPGQIEPRVGGAVKIDFADSGSVIDSRVIAYEPPQLLAYDWNHGNEPARPLRWELASTGQGTCLRLILGIPAGEDAAKACAGFAAHLEMLAAALEGVPIRFPFDLYLAARKAYGALLQS